VAVVFNKAGLVQSVAQSRDEAWEVIKALAKECKDAKSDRYDEAVELGADHGIHPREITPYFVEARAARPKPILAWPESQPVDAPQPGTKP
jgi:hypothetical protein